MNKTHDNAANNASNNESASANSLFSKKRRGTVRRLLGYLMRHRLVAALALALMLISNLLSLIGPKLSGAAIDAIALGNTDFGKVFFYCGMMALFYILSAAVSYIVSVIVTRLSQRIVRQMRSEVMEHLLHLPVAYFDTHPAGDVISRISYDIDTVNATLSSDLLSALASCVTVIGSFVMMAVLSPVMLLVFAVTVPIAVIFTRFKTRRIQPLFRKRSGKLGALNGYAEEMLSGHTAIKAASREAYVDGRFNERNEDAVTAYYNADYHGCIVGPSVNFINNLSLALISSLGGFLYLYGGITLGTLSSFVLYSRRFAGPINEMAGILTEFQSAAAAAERIFRLLDEPCEAPDAADARIFSDIRGDIGFYDVNFDYIPGKPTLRSITMEAKPGKTLAIVGPTGAGKTTLINLLMRFYDAQSGEITLDGTPVTDGTRDSLRKSLAMVLQDAWLFDGTVYENLTYGNPEATREDAEAAAKAVGIHEYILSLPKGYDTPMSDEGGGISKGQQQLMTVARAMLSDARVLILDEATSNVDSRTEALLQRSIERLMKNKTCIVIAHRLSTVRNADTVIVLKEGRIVQRGTHDSLVGAPGFYHDLFYAQFE